MDKKILTLLQSKLLSISLALFQATEESFERELQWCIDQLELGLQTQNPDSRQGINLRGSVFGWNLTFVFEQDTLSSA